MSVISTQVPTQTTTQTNNVFLKETQSDTQNDTQIQIYTLDSNIRRRKVRKEVKTYGIKQKPKIYNVS